jgi:hypothetical protein
MTWATDYATLCDWSRHWQGAVYYRLSNKSLHTTRFCAFLNVKQEKEHMKHTNHW